MDKQAYCPQCKEATRQRLVVEDDRAVIYCLDDDAETLLHVVRVGAPFLPETGSLTS